MKSILRILFSLLLPLIGTAQQNRPDSLRTVLQNAVTDSARYNAAYDLYLYFIEASRDSALRYVEKRLALARQNNMKLAEAASLTSRAYQYNAMGKYSEAFRDLLLALRSAEDPGNGEVQGWKVAQFPIPGKNREIVLATTHHILGGLMRNTGNHEQEIRELKEALRIATEINHPDRQMTANMNLGSAYLKRNEIDSALFFAEIAESFSKNPLAQGYTGNNLLTIGDVYLAKGDTAKAKAIYHKGLHSSFKQNNQADVANLTHRLVHVFLMENNSDSALSYAVSNINLIKTIEGVGYREIDIGVAYEDLFLAYQLNKQHDSAYKYQGLALVSKDSLYKVRLRNLADFQKLSLGETIRLENLEKEKIQTQSKLRTYSLLAGLVVLSIIGFILYRNNRQKQNANKVLEATLSNLKSTQSQLIQSEKMASLGELTAGIAHEIQNPLNFVNNFSEVSEEMIVEAEGSRQEAGESSPVVTELLTDIKQNLAKINQHGKRADAIVKGMLQHSRSTTGNRELTDVNDLVDEYVKLSFHAFRRKDNAFDVNLQTDFDPAVGAIELAPQEVGRVLLNILNNAFYAVNERRKEDPAFSPEVIVQTKKTAKGIEISVKDNGGGVPESIVGKIFQPFFTTKPTGQGTGLGLSLAYDIVKAHGGELKVETETGKGSRFIVLLPIEVIGSK